MSPNIDVHYFGFKERNKILCVDLTSLRFDVRSQQEKEQQSTIERTKWIGIPAVAIEAI